MTIKMLVFDYRNTEKKFFENKKYENFDITYFKESLNEETLKNLSPEHLENTTVISVFVDSEVTKEVIDAFKNLRIISTRSTGFDHINHSAAVEKNIDVINIQNYGAKSVAQYTVGLMIALVRKIVPASKYVLTRKKQCQSFVGRDLSKLTIGVIGTGAIGAAVCSIVKGFGMRVLAYDLNKKKELCDDVIYVDFETLLKESDIITLHIPYTGDNLHLFSKKQFDLMKPSAYLINTSRGELIDIFALNEALENKKIKGAALDVLTCEAENFKCEEFAKKLGRNLACAKEVQLVSKMAQMPNVIITPHIAYETQDAIDYILEMTFRGVLDCIKGGSKFKNL